MNDGKIDADGNISGISITVTSMSLGRLTINYIARDDGKDFYGSGTSINGITSTIQATLISTPTTTPSITPSFSAADLKLQNFGTTASAGGWTSDNQYRRTMADVNGDGRADIVGFGVAGTYVALADGKGSFGDAQLKLQNFGAGVFAGGWSNDDLFHRELADVNGDGRADIVGFGAAGTYVALADGKGGFGDAQLKLQNFGTTAGAGGWASQDRYHREVADVNGDGRADIVGFGEAGVYVSLADGKGGFGDAQLKLQNFGAGVSAGGWSNDDLFHRELADVNGDGRADIVGFGAAGTYVALADGKGGFGDAQLKLQNFGTTAGAGGWSSQDRYHRTLADVNGDGRADIVGFGGAGTYVALADGSGGFLTAKLRLDNFGTSGAAGGWSSDDLFHREVVDVSGDGRADIVGFGAAGVYVATSLNNWTA
ncbi:FG-GAP repeat domain-containing protein [Methylobacterium platani]|uniref:FG-GAP repeat domain-containing protein n=1 Tax=Methylobacterium platani TaxID=427683 RepID=UPI001FD8600C|nr:VCBS repeat-containing protein [Methylobacterium platani]